MPTADGGNRLFGLPWYVDTRLLFYRSDLLRAAGHRAAAADAGPSGAARCGDVRQPGGGRSYGALLPLNEPRSAVRAGAAAGTAARRRRQPRRVLAAAVPARARLLRGHLSRRASRRAMTAHADRRTSGTSSRAACSRSTSRGPGTSASSAAACRAERQGDWATAPLPGPDGPGVSTAGGSSLVDVQGLAAQGRGLEADRASSASRRRCSAFTR